VKFSSSCRYDFRFSTHSSEQKYCQTSAACISVGEISRREISLIASVVHYIEDLSLTLHSADEDGLVKMHTASVS
jgi:hypothetical protein